jgi:PTS system mannitol-specific IIA component
MAKKKGPELTTLLSDGSIRLEETATDRDDAIRQVGAALHDAGAVDAAYADAMIDRENSVSTYVGEGISIPHATGSGNDSVSRDAIVILRFAEGVDWDGNEVRVCVGIAARGSGHIALLSQLATVLLARDNAARLRAATSEQQVLELLRPESTS